MIKNSIQWKIKERNSFSNLNKRKSTVISQYLAVYLTGVNYNVPFYTIYNLCTYDSLCQGL